MFTPRMRRRRHSIDTYIRGEVEKRMQSAENVPIPLRPNSPEETSTGAEESPVASASQSDRLSA